jgi:hypothetical protein
VRWSAYLYQASEHANITNIGRRHFWFERKALFMETWYL